MTRPSPRSAGLLLGAVFLAGAVLFFPAVEDPVREPGTYVGRDVRRHRLGDLTHAQTVAIVEDLMARTGSANPEEAERAFAALVDVHRRRDMIKEAVDWLNEGRAKFPGSALLKAQELELVEALSPW